MDRSIHSLLILIPCPALLINSQATSQQVARTFRAAQVERKESKNRRQKARLGERAFKEIDYIMDFLGIEILDPDEEIVMRTESECAAASSSSSVTAVRHSLSNVSLAPVKEGIPALPLLPLDTVSPCNQSTPPVLESSRATG